MATPRSALFVIDIQHELGGDPKTRIPEAERVTAAADKILTTMRSLIDTYRGKGAQSPFIIVVVQHEEAEGDGTLVRGSEEWKVLFPPREGVAEEILVSKTTSTFWGT